MGKLTEFTTGLRSQLVIGTYKNWLRKHDRVLDAGCGDGILSAMLRDAFAIKVTGCDIDNYIQKDIPLTLMDNESSLPFPDKSFDVVMFNDALHHTSFINQTKLLKEAFRVSDTVLLFEDEPTVMGAIVEWSINKFHNWRMPLPFTFRSHSQWMHLFETLGIRYEFKEVRKPLLYPLTHEAFVLRMSKAKK
jgi:SAM-dependent methyltransferase